MEHTFSNFQSVIMSSLTISLSDNKPDLSVDFLPALELDDAPYECALVYFKTFNSIPNVDKSNNLFHYGTKTIEIPEGAYELADIIRYLKRYMEKFSGDDSSNIVEIEANTNTAKCMISSSKLDVHFEKANTIGSLFGFSSKLLKAGEVHWSDRPIDILITNTIRIECSMVEGSFINDKPSHVLHEFSPTVPPGYQIVECPTNIIYLPVKRNNIQRIEVRIVNEYNNLVNFRGENISLRLHIRRAITS